MLTALSGVVLVGSWAQSELPADGPAEAPKGSVPHTQANDCRDCRFTGFLFFPLTGNHEIDQANRDAVNAIRRQRAAAAQQRFFEEARQRKDKLRNTWKGTRGLLSPHPRVTDAQRKSAAPFVDLFKTDPPAPKVRLEHFDEFLHKDSPDRCVGWRAYLIEANEVDDGWLLKVEVGVDLVGRGAVVISEGTTNETWHVSRKGELTFVEGSPGIEAPVVARL